MAQEVNTLHQGNDANEVKTYAPIDMTKYDLSRPFMYTQRFGQLALILAEIGEPKDKIYMGNADNIDSYTLAAPLKSNVYHKKDYFQIPMRAIMPINWDKYYEQPKIGNDVADDVGTTVKEFPNKVQTWFAFNLGNITTAQTNRKYFWRWFIEMGYFYSYGSLLAASGYSMERMMHFYIDNVEYTYDEYFEHFCDSLITAGGGGNYSMFTINYKGQTINVYSAYVPENLDYTAPKSITFRRFLELVHEDPTELTSVTTEPTALKNWIEAEITKIKATGATIWHGTNAPCDLATLHAYQMVYTHYYSNDNVDYLYSADLYRQNLKGVVWNGVITNAGDWDTDMMFTYNGVRTDYDATSAHVFDYLVTQAASVLETEEFISIIFAWRNSLRYMDYFTGSRLNPLSIGNVDVAVNMGTGTVNVLDIVGGTMYTRYYNAVNRSGRKEASYLENIYHIKPEHDRHDPIWLGHIQDTVYCTEVENTGAAQLTTDAQGNRTGMAYAITGQMKGSNGERYAFEVEVKERSVMIGIGYFDIERVYTHATRRTMFHENRFDMFNPFMQTIGDQKIYQSELTDIPVTLTVWDAAFAYGQRHGEYKQSFGRAVGGFATKALKQWAFVANEIDRGEDKILTPDYVRSSCVELDRYYLSLTNHGLADYFHFIIISYNKLDMVRNMILSPNIL